jgi:hypothetical protein
METSKGGIGAMYTFHADGVVDFSPGAVVEMRWRVENDQLILASGTAGDPEQKMVIKWLSDDKVQFLSGDAVANELTRAGKRSDTANPLIGEWLGTREMNGHKLEVHWLFSSDSKSLLLMPFVSQHGHYEISKSTLHLDVTGTPATDYKYQVRGDVFTISKPDGSHESRFERY